MQVRERNEQAMGCPECDEANLEGSEVHAIFLPATTEEECRAVNPGGANSFGSGSLPAELTGAAAADSSACSLLIPMRGMRVLTSSAVVLGTVVL